jgi:hypothetical protein
MDRFNEKELEALHMLLKEPERVKRLVQIAEMDERREWLFSVIRRIAAWVAGVLGAVILFWDTIIRVLKG